MRPQGAQEAVVLHDVRFVGGNDLGAFGQLRAVLGQLLVDGVKVGNRVAALAAGDVHHMNQQAAAVNVAQKFVAQARTFACALDNTGDVGHYKACAAVYIDHAEVGVKGGEMVIGNLGIGAADYAQECGFAYVGEAY